MRGALGVSWVRATVVSALAAISAAAAAQDFFEGTTTHSVQNDNFLILSGIDMGMVSETDFYYNAFNVVGGSSWNEDIQINFNGSYWDNNLNAAGNYALGTQIRGTQDWYFGGFFGGMFLLGLNGTVAQGTYSTTIELLGGETDTSMDVLHSFTETVEVVDFGLLLSSPDTNIVLPPLGSTVIRHRLQNTSGTPFRLSSRYYSWSMAGRDQFDIEFSDGYPDELLPSSDQTVNHLDVTALPTFTTPFTFRSGIIGGWYDDDAVYLQAGEHTLSPVPEPATLVALGGAIAALAARRRKRA